MIAAMADSMYDAIIVGAGHNGLVAGFYLARAGRKVLLCERRGFVGGACIIELNFLNGRDNLDIPFTSLVGYDE